MAKWHGTLVAAKTIKDSSAIALGDFRSELDVLRRVHHPNAVQFLGACTKQTPYILVSGTSKIAATDKPRVGKSRASLPPSQIGSSRRGNEVSTNKTPMLGP